MLPQRAEEAKRRLWDDLNNGQFMWLRHTYVDGGWMSRAKIHLAAVFICRPSTTRQLLSI